MRIPIIAYSITGYIGLAGLLASVVFGFGVPVSDIPVTKETTAITVITTTTTTEESLSTGKAATTTLTSTVTTAVTTTTTVTTVQSTEPTQVPTEAPTEAPVPTPTWAPEPEPTWNPPPTQAPTQPAPVPEPEPEPDPIPPIVSIGTQPLQPTPTSGTISIYKTNKATGTAIKGCVLTVERNGIIVQRGTTDANGYCTFTLPLGSYLIREVSWPTDTKPLTAIMHVSITGNAPNARVTSQSVPA